MPAKLINITLNYMQLLKTATGMCHQSMATDEVIKHIIDAGHLSVLEHCYASFEASCSISTLLQLTRHRHFSFTVQSSRVSELTETYNTGNSSVDWLTNVTMENYSDILRRDDITHEQAAYILPKAAMYNFVITGNFRAWFEYLPKRLCKRALPEHRKLAEEFCKHLAIAAPEIFYRNMMNCKNCKERSCDFN